MLLNLFPAHMSTIYVLMLITTLAISQFSVVSSEVDQVQIPDSPLKTINQQKICSREQNQIQDLLFYCYDRCLNSL